MPESKPPQKVNWENVCENILRRAAEKRIESTSSLGLIYEISRDPSLVLEAPEAINRKLGPVFENVTDGANRIQRRLFTEAVGREIDDDEFLEAWRALARINQRHQAARDQYLEKTARETRPLKSKRLKPLRYPRSPRLRALRVVLINNPDIKTAREACFAADREGYPFAEDCTWEEAYEGNPKGYIQKLFTEVRKGLRDDGLIIESTGGR